MRNREILLFALLIMAAACQPKGGTGETNHTNQADTVPPAPLEKTDTKIVYIPDFDTTEWVEITSLIPRAKLDIKYATTDNFVSEQMYDCGRCLVRPEVGKALQVIEQELNQQSLGLLFFDCYRPRPIQWKLWNKVPDPRYVADPRKGSMHNRGVAVDLTIINSDGIPLEMGTHYDYFGPKAYHNYTDLPDSVLANRKMLREIMEQHQFRSTSTEWWHYSYKPKTYPISDMVWNCPDD